MNYEKIGEFIKEKRKERNLTQKELASKIGVTDKAISKWERGLGCPDVSILEILSEELDCSILELLKGRKIDNEVIPITEADDYIKESMRASKDTLKAKITSILNKGIILSIILIGGVLLFLNIVQILYITKEYHYPIEREEYKRINNKIEIIHNNLEIINNNQGNYTNEDYKDIINLLNENINTIENTKLYKHYLNREDISYHIDDILVYNIKGDLISNEMKLTRILEKYKETHLLEYYRNVTTDSFIAMGIGQDFLVTYMSYLYRLNPYEDEAVRAYKTNHKELRSISYHLKSDLSRLVLLTELVIEVGEIHE